MTSSRENNSEEVHFKQDFSEETEPAWSSQSSHGNLTPIVSVF